MIDIDEIQPKQNGKIDYLSNEDYHKLDAISASGLKMMLKSYRLYYLKSKLKRVYSPALDIGTALHEALLEPDKFNIDTYSGLKAPEVERLDCMINNGKVMFDYILSKTQNEVSFTAHDEVFTRKIRLDAYDEAKGIIYDVKTSKHSTPSAFANDAYKLGYHIQAAFYVDTLKLAGYNVKHFAFLVIPSVSPFEPFAFRVTDELLEEGRGQYSYLLDGYSDFLKTKDKEVSFLEMNLPSFLRNN